MKIHAYREEYLNHAQTELGEAFDFAVNDCNIPGNVFSKLFAASSIGKRFEKGEPAIIAGKSGIELVMDVVLETTGKQIEAAPKETMERTVEYWIGWAVAYYQWYSDRGFSEFFEVLSYDDLRKVYYTLHEADISKFVELSDEKVRMYFKNTNLKRIRNLYGCTQSDLAKQSGVRLRSIQMYEQRQKDINQARVETLYRISKVLGCTIEDLIEK